MYPVAYQKWFYVLLCDEENKPVVRAAYADCVFQQSTTLTDKNFKEIFEGDRVRVRLGARVIEDTVGDVPDMFRSRRLHPLDGFLKKHGLTKGDAEHFEIEVMDVYVETHRRSP